jgi:hypothetical protein
MQSSEEAICGRGDNQVSLSFLFDDALVEKLVSPPTPNSRGICNTPKAYTLNSSSPDGLLLWGFLWDDVTFRKYSNRSRQL